MSETNNALSVLNLGSAIALPTSKYAADDKFGEMSSGSFLPYLQLAGSSSNIVKKRKANQGDFVVAKGKDTLVANLGEKFNCLPFAWRPKAILFAGADTKSYYNPESPSFKDIQKQSNAKVQAAKYGPEFLVWLPDQNMFVSFFFNNPTMRRVAGDLKALLPTGGPNPTPPTPATITSKLIETEKFSWHGPEIVVCSTPISLPEQGSPEAVKFLADLQQEAAKFANPPEEEVEVDDSTEDANTPERAR